MKIGVIGLGSIGLRHAKNLVDLGHEVRGYDPVMLRRLMFNGVLWDRDETLAMSEAIIIASPTPSHLIDVQDAVYGKKHIFIEKPVADGIYDIPLLFTTARANKCIVMMGNNLRMHSCVKQAKRWMEVIGNPIWASFTVSQYSDKPAYLRDGVWLNWLSHEADLALYFLGPAKVTAATGDETIGDMCLLHESGARSTVHGDYLAPVERRGFCILGTNGNIGVDLVSRTAVLKLKVTPTFNSQSHFTGEDSYDQNYIDEMQAFVDRIEGKYALGATGAEGLACLEILLEARRMAGLT